MKKIILVAAIFLIGFSNTQIRAQLNINIRSQPVWGPTGYNHVDYYYLPDVESYYNVQKRQYMYQNDGKWILSPILPKKYSNYDLYKGYKVVLNEPKPFLQFDEHKVKYLKYKGFKVDQPYIKNSNDSKYFVVKGHPKYKGNNKYGDKHDGTIGHQKNYKEDNDDNDNYERSNNGKGHENKNHKEKGNKGKGREHD